MAEKRTHKRVKTTNLLSYVSLDKDGHPLEQGMGRTQDISLGGFLMETHVPIDSQYIKLLTIDNMDELIKFTGLVAYSIGAKNRHYYTGVRFIETNERITKIIIGMIKAFNVRKNRFQRTFVHQASEINLPVHSSQNTRTYKLIQNRRVKSLAQPVFSI